MKRIIRYRLRLAVLALSVALLGVGLFYRESFTSLLRGSAPLYPNPWQIENVSSVLFKNEGGHENLLFTRDENGVWSLGKFVADYRKLFLLLNFSYSAKILKRLEDTPRHRAQFNVQNLDQWSAQTDPSASYVEITLQNGKKVELWLGLASPHYSNAQYIRTANGLFTVSPSLNVLAYLNKGSWYDQTFIPYINRKQVASCQYEKGGDASHKGVIYFIGRNQNSYTAIPKGPQDYLPFPVPTPELFGGAEGRLAVAKTQVESSKLRKLYRVQCITRSSIAVTFDLFQAPLEQNSLSRDSSEPGLLLALKADPLDQNPQTLNTVEKLNKRWQFAYYVIGHDLALYAIAKPAKAALAKKAYMDREELADTNLE